MCKLNNWMFQRHPAESGYTTYKAVSHTNITATNFLTPLEQNYWSKNACFIHYVDLL